MDNLINFEDDTFKKLALSLAKGVSGMLTLSQKNYLGSTSQYVEALLMHIRLNEDNIEEDSIAMSAMAMFWSLTDESPESCKMFVIKGGLDVYADILKVINEKFEIYGQKKMIFINKRQRYARVGLVGDQVEVIFLRGVGDKFSGNKTTSLTNFVVCYFAEE